MTADRMSSFRRHSLPWLLLGLTLVVVACVEDTTGEAATASQASTTQTSGGGIGGSGNLAGSGGIGGSGINNQGGGIGGSGLFSYGRITAFGSIFVNGIEFFLDSATTVQLRQQASSPAALEIGMIVQVRGQRDSSAPARATASEIVYDAAIEGPVDGQVVPDQDDLQRRFVVLGQQIVIDRWRTTFLDTDYTALASGDVIEVSGFVDANGILQASRVVRHTPFVADVTIVERHGRIGTVDTLSKRFDIAGLTIDYSQADLGNPAVDPASGQTVAIRGTLSAPSATLLNAATIRLLQPAYGQDGDEAVLEGIITRYVSPADFDINGLPVDASNAELNPPTVVLAPNTRVRIEGLWQNRRIVASNVKVRKLDLSLFAPVAAVDPASQTLELQPLSGQPTIRVQVTTASQLTDEVNGITPYRVADIQPGDFLLIAGIDTGAGIPLMVKQLDHVVPKDILIEGVIDASSATTVTVHGVVYPYDASTTLSGVSAAALASPADFQNQLRLGTTIVRLIDKPVADGIADTIEIISP